MKTNSNFSNVPASRLLYAGLLLAGSIGNLLLSPKWASPIWAWIAPACMLFYFRHASFRFKFLWFFLALIASQMIASYDVAPFPLPVLAIVSLVDVLKIIFVYLIDRWISKKSNRFITTLIFPAAFVTKEFLDISFSGGAWWSVANTQYSFTWLAQLASVTGLAGISFLIYWFAAISAWCMERYFNKREFMKGIWIYAGVFIMVMLFGIFRFYSNDLKGRPIVKIAGVSVPTTSILENCYKDVYHQNISIDLKTSMVSGDLQKVNATLVPFIEDPDTSRFANGYHAMSLVNDSLFSLSQQAADKGANIIVWSEANAIMPAFMRDAFISRGQAFASKNKVYLLMAIAAFQPGKITPGKMFLENACILVSPTGGVLNVFHKNHPVPFVEHSVPGDGKIPAIETPYGIVSTSICYDADMPSGMQQLAHNRSDVLLLPSGDWYDIAPFHSYMAMFRGIENGCTVVRQASGGLSLVTDYRGNVQASFDFYKPGKKFWMADIVTGHVATVYSVIGDAFAYVCIAITAFSLLFLIAKYLLKGTRAKFSKLNIPQPA